MAHGVKRQRPGAARAIEDGMKLHLREVRAGGRHYRVITPRPGADVLFSTNYFHDTWHVVTDAAGARMIARLLWGLAFQRQPGTVALLHGEFLCPTPFDADPSDPVLLVPTHLTSFDRAALGELRRRLPALGLPRTIRWHTHGLDAGLGKPVSDRGDQKARWKLERCDRAGGFICYSAPPEVLRWRALDIHSMGRAPYPSNYEYLAEHGNPYGDGEIQTFRDYRRQLSHAAVARREVLDDLEGPVDPETLRERVWVWKREVEKRR